MSRQIIYRQSYIIVIRNFSPEGNYFTVVNTKKDTHTHINGSNPKAAIMICRSAKKCVIPEKYPIWMKNSINRIL